MEEGAQSFGGVLAFTVTHNMAQTRRASRESNFMLMGKVVEHAETARMFVTPAKQETADSIEGVTAGPEGDMWRRPWYRRPVYAFFEGWGGKAFSETGNWGNAK